MLKLITASLLILPIAFGQTALTTAQIAKRVSPSVVVIQGKTDSGVVLGSGFIVSKDGKIVTNLHVIRDMKTASVQLANGRVLDSILVRATDERRDLAIIEISGFDPNTPHGDTFDQILDQIPQRSQVLDLGNSDNVSVGEPVVVVGSPRGLEGTVTAGILSAIRDSGDGFKVLQTDAAVNPGNSGGPLVNNKGQAIGVVSFKLRSTEGLNFAYPINYVRVLLNNLHEPITLEQMRQTSAGPTIQKTTGPSLKETLDWLKDNIPLATIHYVTNLSGFPSPIGQNKDVSVRTIATHFVSCSISFDSIEVTVWDKFPANPITITTRYTVPLGALTSVSLMRLKLPVKVSPAETIEKPVVVLAASENVILSAEHEDLRDKTKAESGKDAFITFDDEPIANRVIEAFRHAADLCRGREPF